MRSCGQQGIFSCGGSPGSTPQQSCVLTAGTAYKSACYHSSEVMGGGHIWPGFFCGEETWEAGNGFSLWQCRLFPNQLDLATWGELILRGCAPFSKASLSLSITFLATKHRESVYRCSQHLCSLGSLLAPAGLGQRWPQHQEQEESCKAEDRLLTLLQSPAEACVPALTS